jgi:hypothetical protein
MMQVYHSDFSNILLFKPSYNAFALPRLGFDRCDKLSINYRYQRPIIAWHCAGVRRTNSVPTGILSDMA